MFEDLSAFFQEQQNKSGVRLDFELDPSLPETLIGDPMRLQQIFINLVENAFKFTDRGAVTVRAAMSGRGSRGGADGDSQGGFRDGFQGDFRDDSQGDLNQVTLDFAVEDTGIGMSREQMDEIFAAFNQGDNSASRKYGGIGIGLTITRQMVELMGGEIKVASQEGQGTTFTFTCAFALAGKELEPGAAGARGTANLIGAAASSGTAALLEAETAGLPETADLPATEAENAVLRGMRVLLVEDNEINALIAMELLNAVDVETTTALNGQEALDRLEESVKAHGGPAFDLILMDLQMPIMDGYEATKIIKDTPEYRDVPIYALTAHAFPEERDRCFALGMEEHLTKPIDVDNFYRALRRVREKQA
jgi:CheY-like chemotaxis protein